jgi:hypothetical protein
MTEIHNSEVGTQREEQVRRARRLKLAGFTRRKILSVTSLPLRRHKKTFVTLKAVTRNYKYTTVTCIFVG